MMRDVLQSDIDSAIRGCRLNRKSSAQLDAMRKSHSEGDFRELFASKVIVAAIDQINAEISNPSLLG